MQIREIMTKEPVTVTRESRVQEAARLMREHDCGMIPVVDDDRRPIGAITDRDITVRAVGEGKNPLEMRVGDVMSVGGITVKVDEDVERATQKLESHRVRRVAVVDGGGKLVGVLAQADLARKGDGHVEHMVKEVSKPGAPPRVH